MNAVPVNIPRYVIVLTGQEGCVAKTIKNTKRRGATKMKRLDAINMMIASKSTIDGLIEKGYICQGKDGQLHVIEQRESTTNNADQS